jgi:phosphohistidine phosphatase
MRRLTLIRHAKSNGKDKTLSDFERPLNHRGRQNAPEMGKRLAERHFRPDAILTSPARRALATAQLIAGEIAWPPEQLILQPQIYEADVATLAELIRTLDDRWRHVALVGHNPGFTDFGNWLADAGLDNIPTCGILDLELEIESWHQAGPESARVLDFDFPKKD